MKRSPLLTRYQDCGWCGNQHIICGTVRSYNDYCNNTGIFNKTEERYYNCPYCSTTISRAIISIDDLYTGYPQFCEPLDRNFFFVEYTSRRPHEWR